MKKIRFEKLIGQIGAMGLFLTFTGCIGYQGIQPHHTVFSNEMLPKVGE